MEFISDIVNKSQSETPIINSLRDYANNHHAAFYTPGHKLGQGISNVLADLLGRSIFKVDLTELPQLDNLSAPEGVIKEAQQLAAEAFGAEHTWFLVNGSTVGIMAAILATCGTGDKIILPRNVHQCAIAGLIISGAIPIFINPEYDPVLDISHSITPAALQDALNKYPEAKAVMMVYPTYYGMCGDVAAIAQIAHQHHIPLLVDEAHGPHFAFHPDLPTSALAAGADLTVQSTHKVLGALTQASMLHIQGNLVDIDRLNKALQMLQSSSPSYLLLASLDAARQQMALEGKQLMTRTLELALQARTRISQIEGLSVLTPTKTPGCLTSDRTRLTVTVSSLGLTGFAADEILHQQFQVTAELASLHHLTFIISLGNTQADIDQLVQALTTIANQQNYQLVQKSQAVLKRGNEELQPIHPSSFIPPPAISPRDAFFSKTKTLPVSQSLGSISAEIICPYPPGIPVLMPGEVITPQAIEYLQKILADGGTITGCSDRCLETVIVVRE